MNKDYSLRITIKLTSSSEEEAKKKCQILLNELPRMEETVVTDWSVYDFQNKKIIQNSNKR